jgi:hypothetical protein
VSLPPLPQPAERSVIAAASPATIAAVVARFVIVPNLSLVFDYES